MNYACRLVLVVALVSAAAACGGGGSGDDDGGIDATPIDAPIDAAVPPVFRNPVTLPDLELAQMAAALLGEGTGEMCDACHGLTRSYLRNWDAMTDAGEAACLTDLAPTTPAAAMTIVNCLRESDNLWHPGKIGIYATGAGLQWFEYVFRLAYGDGWQPQFDEWTDRVWMPRGGRTPFTQPQFDIVAEWFARDLPNLDQVIPSDPVPPPCTTSIGPQIATHVAAMQTQGWRQLNRDANINMFGCAGAATTRDCLSTYPLSTANSWSMGWTAAAPGQKIRILRELNYSTNFWTRSSADGRFVAHGGNSSGNGSTVIDLNGAGREIFADALYDPGFFPDNSGFILQGGGGQFCKQSLLTAGPASISFNEPECTTLAQVGLYQHLGRLNGGDYFTVHGQFSSDNGGHNVTGNDPSTSFSQGSQNTFTPMIHNGTDYVAKPQVAVSTPYEGDMEMSQSAKLVIARTGMTGGSGFVVRQVTYTDNGAGGYIVNAPIVARYCVRGGKPGWSYDERWLTFHHYVGANDWSELGYASATDPGFVALRQQGAANTYVLDMLTGESRRVTTMGPGQYALYPHFRSDGWLYIQIRDRIRGREYVVASDVALVFEAP